MPEREDEYGSGMKEPKGRGLCPFCGSSNISYNERFHSWQCNKCEHSFPTPSYGHGEDFGQEARWFGKTTEEERQAEFAEAARKARAKRDQESGISKSGYPSGPDRTRYYGGEHPFQKRKGGVPGCLIFFIVVFAVGILIFGVYNLYKSDNQETTDYIDPADTSDAGEPTSKDNGDEASNVIGDYYLGLVYSSESVIGGSECYGKFIVLINNKNAVDPSYSQLMTFLQQDTTDQFPYQDTLLVPEFYYPPAESYIDLEYVEDIIYGRAQPDDPRICADFAERLHNEAEMAGIRCAYVDIGLAGSEFGHALNAFQTTDRGLIYIDDTGVEGDGPPSCDTTVEVQVGQQYIPVFLFDTSGWLCESMGTVTEILIIWDGEWKD